MNGKRKLNLMARTAVFLSILSAVILAAAIGLFYYIFSIPEPEGMSLAHWPQDFTNSFAVWASYENQGLSIKETGLERLDEYGLWIQFIDETGREIFSHNKPAGYPQAYTASQLIALSASDFEGGSTVFVNRLEGSGGVCSYIVGFPYDIGKYMLYYNGQRVARLSPVAQRIIFLSFGCFILSVLGYSLWLSRKLTAITRGIKDISLRAYQPQQERGCSVKFSGSSMQWTWKSGAATPCRRKPTAPAGSGLPISPMT